MKNLFKQAMAHRAEYKALEAQLEAEAKAKPKATFGGDLSHMVDRYKSNVKHYFKRQEIIFDLTNKAFTGTGYATYRFADLYEEDVQQLFNQNPGLAAQACMAVVKDFFIGQNITVLNSSDEVDNWYVKVMWGQ